MKEQSDMPRQTPLVELLLAVPEDARLIYEHSPTESQSIPVGPMCRQAAMELATATRERDEARISVAMLWAAAKLAESALADIGDSDHEPTDDLAWCELRAQRTLPVVRFALAATEAKP